jgi:cystathionine beta-lyase/cystathionine gamma-synthase
LWNWVNGGTFLFTVGSLKLVAMDHTTTLPYPTLLIHADDDLAPTSDIAPTLHPSTTYHYPLDPADWRPAADGLHPDGPVYSRVAYSTTERVEKVLGDLAGGNSLWGLDLNVGYAVTYGSGLSAIHALLIHINPRKICISVEAGYHGTKGVAALIQRLNNLVRTLHTLPVNRRKFFPLSGCRNCPRETFYGLRRR